MLKRIGIPALALVAILAFFAPAQAKAGVHWGVTVGPAYPYPYAVSPYSYGYPYWHPDPYYYNGYPAYPYPYSTYVYPYGRFYYGGHGHDHDRHWDRGYRGGHEFHERGGGGGHWGRGGRR